MKRKSIIIGVIAALMLIVVIIFIKSGKKEIQIDTIVVENDTIQTVITATGYVQPVDKIDVGTQVSGVIEKIYADFNSQVKKGQLLAELDKSTLREKVIQANASVISAQSDLTFSQQNYNRIKQLYEVKAATETSYEEAINKLAQAKTSLDNAKASLHQAQVNLSYAEIYSPIDGVVLNRAVEQGQTVAASFNTPTLFTIANNLKKMQVEADIDEADIGDVKLGQAATFTVDAFSDDIFSGTVYQIRLQPTVKNNVVTYTVIIEAPNPEEKLFPGMTASVSIVTHSETGLVIPVEALSTTFSPNIMKELNIQNTVSAKGVWVKTSEGIIHKELKTGVNNGTHIIVEEGLKAGDSIILSTSYEKELNTTSSNPLIPSKPQKK
ncbi:efflux RND transporter periplasmic adaptor subunit [Parabacteroides sp. Marseille-P3160]|uniref:efflux RND transporter periplasmic adaptor subunit n=1 Tax=Parabacteroides sp. Marseille-P3160 TaxID=1917887 RepID=UPI0009BC6938|nr:efflux RND transporter periplasmic adaptor subunit [Parabacteroides sp. Marseille-P3160]